METKQTVRIMVRAYAGILFTLGCLFIALAVAAFALAIGPLANYARWGFAITYQLAIWGGIQIISGLFLSLISRRLISFIIGKEAEV